MNYKIKEAYVLSDEKGVIQEVIVLWEDGEDSVSGTYIDRNTPWLTFDLTKVILSETLLQNTAKYGHYINTERKQKYFSHIAKNRWSK